MKILIATKNPGKFKGIQETLQSFDAEFVSLEDLGIKDDFEEEGESFAEIALGKARFYHELSGLATVADDSGIIVGALAGELGLKTRRWGAGPDASDEAWLDIFMKRMKNETNRAAEFVCAAAYVCGDLEQVFEGHTHGVITEAPEAPLHAGIPLSSVFKPEGSDKVYMALSPEEKQRQSHRAKAFSKLLNFLLNRHELVLKRIEQENDEKDVWIVGPATGHMLHWLIRVLEPDVALEIGTSVGYSAVWMASALDKNKRGHLWTIESHDERFARAQKNIEEAGLAHRIDQLKGHAPEIFTKDPTLPEQIDFAFFDATKQEHQSYFDAIFPRMKKGGMIVVDNVLSHRFGKMQQFIEEAHSNTGLQVVEISVGDGLLIARVI